MVYPTKSVANEFLKIAGREGDPISAMKLQKLVFYAHGGHLAIAEEPLVNELVGAWTWGPVFPSLYHEFKRFGNGPILELARTGWNPFAEATVAELPSGAEYEKELIERIWEVYGGYTAIQLSNLTHEDGSPWSNTVAPYQGRIPMNLSIEDNEVKKFFQNKIA